MFRGKTILLSSYVDNECRKPETIKQIIKHDEETKSLYDSLLRSKEINKLSYFDCRLSFEGIRNGKRLILYPILVTAGAILFSLLLLFPLIKHSVTDYPVKNEILYTGVLK